MSKKRFIYFMILFITINFSARFLPKTDFVKNVVQKYHDSLLIKVEKISISNDNLQGNTEGNINNYGLVAETKDAIYFIKDLKLCKVDKELENLSELVVEPSNRGKDTINVVEDWIFYRQGNKIRRVKTDGTNIETIHRDYSLHMNVVGNWVYFISLKDDSRICKIDVNGQNRQFLSDKNIYDMAIHNGKIYYSYEIEDKGYLEVMNIDGSQKQLLLNVKTSDMIVDDEYIYYLDKYEQKLYRMDLKNKFSEKLSNETILKFIKDDNWIFYTIQESDNVNRTYKGLFRMDIDGNNVLSLDEEYLYETGLGTTQDFVFYVSSDRKSLPSLKVITKEGESISKDSFSISN